MKPERLAVVFLGQAVPDRLSPMSGALPISTCLVKCCFNASLFEYYCPSPPSVARRVLSARSPRRVYKVHGCIIGYACRKHLCSDVRAKVSLSH